MDQAGLLRQFLPPAVRPILPETMLVGRAMPVTTVGVGPAAADPPPFGRMLEALDDLRPNEVYVCAAGAPPYALWGELMSVRARVLGAAGAVVDGYYRDTAGIAARCASPCSGTARTLRTKGRAARSWTTARGSASGRSRSIPAIVVVGDRDGVCVVPRAREREIFAPRAREGARARTRCAGRSSAGCRARTPSPGTASCSPVRSGCRRSLPAPPRLPRACDRQWRRSTRANRRAGTDPGTGG